MLAAQESMENCTKKNCFELYGADFMLTQDLQVYGANIILLGDINCRYQMRDKTLMGIIPRTEKKTYIIVDYILI